MIMSDDLENMLKEVVMVYYEECCSIYWENPRNLGQNIIYLVRYPNPQLSSYKHVMQNI